MAESVRVPFGARLERAMTVAGPLCVGIDPHAGLLEKFGININDLLGGAAGGIAGKLGL